MTAATARLREDEHIATCDALAAVAADAPTLCEGWTAHDMAAHLWSLNHLNPGWSGIPRAQHASYSKTKQRWSYAELVGRLRNGAGTLACMPLDPYLRDRHATGEWFVHGEDVRRANDLPARPVDGELAELLWQRVEYSSRILQGLGRGGLVLRHPDGRRHAIRRGSTGVEVTGEPGELMLWVYGRRSVAQVTVAVRR